MDYVWVGYSFNVSSVRSDDLIDCVEKLVREWILYEMTIVDRSFRKSAI